MNRWNFTFFFEAKPGLQDYYEYYDYYYDLVQDSLLNKNFV